MGDRKTFLVRLDPALHEAVQHEGDGSHPVIGHVMRKGYKIGELVLRPAMVGVVDTVPGEPEVTEPDDTPADAPSISTSTALGSP